MKNMAGSRRKKRYKRQSKKVILGILLVVALLGGAVMYKTKTLQAKDDRYAAREENIKSQIESEEQKASELEEQEIYVKTKKYIEEIAKTKLGLVMPGETLLKPKNND